MLKTWGMMDTVLIVYLQRVYSENYRASHFTSFPLLRVTVGVKATLPLSSASLTRHTSRREMVAASYELAVAPEITDFTRCGRRSVG